MDNRKYDKDGRIDNMRTGKQSQQNNSKSSDEILTHHLHWVNLRSLLSDPEIISSWAQ